HDEAGIVWPRSVAPFDVHLCALGVDNPDVRQAAEDLYRDLLAAHVEVLFDDRAESPGVKFADSDLIGLPLRVTVSQRTLRSDTVEIKPRQVKEFRHVPRPEAIEAILAELK
ncbi:MAG TPA: His/Gly/Thr/Pro-type tRNA ligase C-terminal domain-containing protein, partial [Chloroflexota bacterium]|nr:His/Gly/Thr/Pro-type tRNA ligase C-terminal domain-containing protein [Chloroflexota bacterium]